MTIATVGLLALLAGTPRSEAGIVTVVVTGVRDDAGQLLLRVFDGAEGFPDDTASEVRSVALPARAGQVTFDLGDLPPGDYAIAVAHDANGNGALDKNGFGAPLEPYGFSRDARGTLGPPAFDDARFKVTADALELAIALGD